MDKPGILGGATIYGVPRFTREDSLAVVAALGEMEPVSGRGEAISAGQGGFGASVY